MGDQKLKKITRSFLCIILALMMAVTLCAVPASAASVKLNKTSLELPTGYSYTLKVTGASSVKWSSQDSSIVKIKSSKGSTAKIVAKKTGTTYINAKVGAKTLKCKVTVKKSFITPSSSNVSVSKGGSKTITLTVKGSKDIVLTNSDKSVCSTSWGQWNGDKIKLTIKGKKAGTAQIKVYTKKFSQSTAKTITVKVGSNSNSTSNKNTANKNNYAVPDESYEELAFVDEYGNWYIFVEWGGSGEWGGTGSDQSSGQNNSQNDIREEPEETSSSMTEQVVTLVNQERAAAGLSPLTSDPELNRVAQMRAEELVQKFDHTRPNGSDCFSALDEAGIYYSTCGENIAAGQRSASEVMNSWMNSPGHKANILTSGFSKIGVGFYKSNSGYKYFWVQMFTG